MFNYFDSQYRTAGAFRPGFNPNVAKIAALAVFAASITPASAAGLSIQLGGGLGAVGFILLVGLIYCCMRHRGHSRTGSAAAGVVGASLTEALVK